MSRAHNASRGVPIGADLVRAAPVFAALGDPTRLRVVARLSASGPQSISALTEGAGVTRQAVTKHLHALSEAGLVRGHSAGRERVWELQPQNLRAAHEWLDRISAQWDSALERLRLLVEDDAGKQVR